MAMHKSPNSEEAFNLIAEWRAGKDPFLVLEELAQLMSAQEESAHDPASCVPHESSLSSATDNSAEQLSLLNAADAEDQQEDRDEPEKSPPPERPATLLFPGVDCSALDLGAQGPSADTAASDFCGPPKPVDFRFAGTEIQLPPPTPRQVRNEAMLAAQAREHMRIRALARAHKIDLSARRIGAPAERVHETPLVQSALELLETSAVCEHCGNVGAQLDIPRAPYRYVCSRCLEAMRSPVPEFLRQVRCRGSQQLRQRAGVGGEVLFYDPADISHVVESVQKSSEFSENTLSFLARLVASGHRRPLYTPPSNWSQKLEELEKAHPNFEEVIQEILRPMLAIRAQGGRARPIPMLLLGEPGVGKTHFARALADLMQVPSTVVDMASAQSGSTLSGSSAFWSNSAPGELSNLLAFGRSGRAAHADPVVFLDEVDKVGHDLRYDPLGALYQLLEVESARQFIDLSLPGLRLDASNVCWILAANSLQGIPAPILSRVRVIEIHPPGREHQQDLLRRIFSQMVSDIGIPSFSKEFPDQVAQDCSSWGLREFKNVVNVAIGRALAAGRSAVAPQDFETSTGRGSGRRQQGIGFI